MARILKIGDKFYDTGTKNKTFIQIHKDLRVAGVKNCYFMLEIIDCSLVTVDPYAEDAKGHTTLTKDQRDRVALEIKRNPWYYIREIARIKTTGATRGMIYKANKANIAQTWCFLNGIDSWVCITRQKGKTKCALSIQTWGFQWGTTDSLFMFINKDSENAQKNLEDFKDQIAYLPEYLVYKAILTEDGKVEKGADSAQKYSCPVTNNSIAIRGHASSISKAMSIGRGFSAPIIHYDEVEFCSFIDTIVENSYSTYSESARSCKERGKLYGRIFTSTPGDPDTPEGKCGERLLTKTVKWREEFYDMHPDQVRRTLFGGDETKDYDGEHIGVAYIEYSYKEIGLTLDWFKREAASVANKLTVRREILLQRLRGSTESPYDRDDVEAIIDMCRKPIRTITLEEVYSMDIYDEINPNIPYIFSVDCSTGTAKDNTAITIINPYTEMPVAELESSWLGEPSLVRLIITLVTKMVPKAIVAIERNHVGDSIIAFLMESIIAGRLYFDKYKEIAEENMKSMETRESMLKASARLKTYYGVYTEGRSRDAMFSILGNRIQAYKDKFVTQNITRDISKLVMKGGKIQAMAGWHDDSIMSYLIGMYVLKYGNNLATFGFERGDVVNVTMTEGGGLLTPENIDTGWMGAQLSDIVEKRRNQIQVGYMDRQYMEQLMNAQIERKHEAYHGYTEDDLYINTPKTVEMETFDEVGDDVLSFLSDLRG